MFRCADVMCAARFLCGLDLSRHILRDVIETKIMKGWRHRERGQVLIFFSHRKFVFLLQEVFFKMQKECQIIK
jgi:hypothetical protein